MNIDLTPICQAIVTLLAALITYKLIPWIKSKTTDQQQANLAAAVRVLVFAAEQLFGAGKGEEKIEYVRSHLALKGFDVDDQAIRNEIEAAVYALTPHTSQARKTEEEEKE